jgi:hypothetical protein
MHAPADIDRIDLNVAVVGQCIGHRRHRRIEQQSPAHETPGGGDRNLERGGEHAVPEQNDFSAVDKLQ